MRLILRMLTSIDRFSGALKFSLPPEVIDMTLSVGARKIDDTHD